MFLLSGSKNVGSQANLGLDFLLAVSKVVVSKNGNHNTTLVTESDLKWRSIVVQFILALPAHTRCLLFFCGLTDVWKSKILLLQLADVWRIDTSINWIS